MNISPEEALDLMEPTVKFLASYYSCKDRELAQDLAQEGRLAVVTSLPNYRPAAAQLNTFLTHRIRGAMRHYKRDYNSSIRIPGYIQEGKNPKKYQDDELQIPTTFSLEDTTWDKIQDRNAEEEEATRIIERVGAEQIIEFALKNVRLTKWQKKCVLKLRTVGSSQLTSGERAAVKATIEKMEKKKERLLVPV